MRPTAILPLLLGVVSARPQGFLSEIESVFGFGGGDDSSTTTTPEKTLVPPITAASTAQPTKTGKSHTDPATVTATSKTKPPRQTDSDFSTDEPPASTNASTDTVSETTTNAPTITPTPTHPPTHLTTILSTSSASSTPSSIANASPSSQQSSSGNSNGIPPGGIAVAVIMTLFVVAAAAWLVFRYHPGIRSWWETRQDKKRQERSYREAIDGPFARGGSGVRDAALGASRKSMLASFFAPRTVHLGNGKEIRRKPVNWGASPMSGGRPAAAEMEGTGTGIEKVALTNMAAPMARTGSSLSSLSCNSAGAGGGGSNRPSPALPQKELPPMPPMPPIPPVPPIPADTGKRDMHGILSRKSIFELA